MKRIFALILCLCMAFSLTACWDAPGSAVSPGTSSAMSDSSAVVSDTDEGTENPSLTGTDSSTDTGSVAPSTETSTDTDSDVDTDTDTGSASSSTKPVTNTNTNTGTSTSTSTVTKPTDDPVDLPDTPVPNLVLAGDQYNQQVVVYDMDELDPGDDLDYAETWTCKLNVSHIAGLKYREDTVFGDVILVAAGAGKGQAFIVSYPEGKILWSTKSAGNNPHCIEILPSGNLIVASSSGGTLRMFKTSALLKNDTATAATYEDTALYGAHGVLWDPKYEVVWGLGDDHLRCYTLTGSGTTEALKMKTAWFKNLPADGGHAIAADLTNPDYMYISVNSAVYRFHKESRTFIPTFRGSALVSRSIVKGIAQNQNYNFILAVPNKGIGTKWQNMGYGDWCTDTLITCYTDNGTDYTEQSYKSGKGRAFYKIVAFYGQYQ